MLTDEQARHPFLASLPPHIRRGEAPLAVPRVRPSWVKDLRDFLVAYATCFAAVSLYIA